MGNVLSQICEINDIHVMDMKLSGKAISTERSL